MKTVIIAVLSLLFMGCKTMPMPITMTIPKENNAVMVNYDRPIEDLMARGNYRRSATDGRDKVDLKNFLSNKKGIAELQMKRLCFDSPVRPARVIEEMNKLNFRLVNLQELLAYFEQYPSATQGRAVGALGSQWYDNEVRLLSPTILGDKDKILRIDELGMRHPKKKGMLIQTMYTHGYCFVVVP